MAEHHEEQEQLEEIKRWWQENRGFVLAGLVIGVSAVAGWRGWEWHQTRQAEAAAAIYDRLEEAVDRSDAAAATPLAAQLAAEYAATPYAANGALLLAKTLVDAGDLTQAQAQLQWAVANARDAELAALARVRLARVQVAAGDAAGALTTLAAVATGAYTALAEEARGDALHSLGRTEEARAAYRAALAAVGDNLADQQGIELKLADLGPETTAAAPAPAPTTAPAQAPAQAPASGSTP